MSKSDRNFRTRDFCMVFYDEQVQTVVDYFKRYVNAGVIQYYNFIVHNPDNDGEETGKRHYHACWKCYNAHTTSAVRKQINKLTDVDNLIQEGKVNVCSDYRMYCRYLLHLDDIDKERYFIQQVESNDKEMFAFIINAENDNQANSDKLFLQKAYQLIRERTDLCFMEIMELLVFDKNIKAATVKRYTQHLHTCFLSWRYYQHTERGIAKYNNEIARREKIDDEIKSLTEKRDLINNEILMKGGNLNNGN